MFDRTGNTQLTEAAGWYGSIQRNLCSPGATEETGQRHMGSWARTTATGHFRWDVFYSYYLIILKEVWV